MKLGQAKGAVLIAAAQSKTKIYEYSARKIKLALTGNGNSHKDQVRYMVENKLNLDKNIINDNSSSYYIRNSRFSKNFHGLFFL